MKKKERPDRTSNRGDEKGGGADDDQKSDKERVSDVQMQKLLLITLDSAASPEVNSGLFASAMPLITLPGG
jgi:hypothetical protein